MFRPRPLRAIPRNRPPLVNKVIKAPVRTNLNLSSFLFLPLRTPYLRTPIMSPWETHRSSRATVDHSASFPATAHRSSSDIPEARFDDTQGHDSDTGWWTSDDDAISDSDHESDYGSDSDDCWCGTCDLPRRPRRDFKKRQVTGTPRMSQLTAWGHDARDATLGRRKSRCEISQAESQSSNSQNPPPSDRPTVYRRVSRRQSIASASQVQGTTPQIPQKTDLSPPTSSLGGTDCAQDKQASDGGLYGDVMSAECESLRWEIEQAKAQGYFDHGVDAWQ